MASNHSSYLDPPLIGISCPYEVHFLARKSLFKFKPFGWLIKQLNTHPVERGGGNIETFRLTVEMLKNGKKVVIFPEGSRSLDGSLKKGLQGVGMLVMKAQCAVIPIYIHGAFQAWPPKRKFFKLRGRTACVFGSPLNFEKYSGKEAKQQIADAIMGAIEQLKSWYEGGAKGSPP